MTKLFYMVGIPGSGKSTKANELATKYNAVTISSDAIREELYGNENIQGNGAVVFAKMHERLVEAIDRGTNVIYDATNVRANYRRQFLKENKDLDCEKIAVFMNTPLETCLKNNQGRARVVPDSVIEGMHSRLNIPTINEGWDKVEIVDWVEKK